MYVIKCRSNFFPDSQLFRISSKKINFHFGLMHAYCVVRWIPLDESHLKITFNYTQVLAGMLRKLFIAFIIFYYMCCRELFFFFSVVLSWFNVDLKNEWNFLETKTFYFRIIILRIIFSAEIFVLENRFYINIVTIVTA